MKLDQRGVSSTLKYSIKHGIYTNWDDISWLTEVPFNSKANCEPNQLTNRHPNFNVCKLAELFSDLVHLGAKFSSGNEDQDSRYSFGCGWFVKQLFEDVKHVSRAHKRSIGRSDWLATCASQTSNDDDDVSRGLAGTCCDDWNCGDLYGNRMNESKSRWPLWGGSSDSSDRTIGCLLGCRQPFQRNSFRGRLLSFGSHFSSLFTV